MENRAKQIKKKILILFLIFIGFCAFFSFLLFFAVLYYVNEKNMTLSFVFSIYWLALLLISLVIFALIIKTVLKLDSYMVLDSLEINKIISKNTAPYRRKYALFHDINIKNQKVILALKKELEYIYGKLKQKQEDQ